MNKPKKFSVTLDTLQSHDHIAGDIERGVEIFEKGNIEFKEQTPRQYWAKVQHKDDITKPVIVTFTRDGKNIEDYFCICTLKLEGTLVCRHIIAMVIAIQGGVL